PARLPNSAEQHRPLDPCVARHDTFSNQKRPVILVPLPFSRSHSQVRAIECLPEPARKRCTRHSKTRARNQVSAPTPANRRELQSVEPEVSIPPENLFLSPAKLFRH